MVCAGDIGGRRTVFGRRRPTDTALPGPWVLVLGTTASRAPSAARSRRGADAASLTLVIRSDPPLLVTHVPLTDGPAGCVNVHGREHTSKPLREGRWINVSVEQTLYRPVDVRMRSSPWRRPSPRAGRAGAHDGPSGAARAPRGTLARTVEHGREYDAERGRAPSGAG